MSMKFYKFSPSYSPAIKQSRVDFHFLIQFADLQYFENSICLNFSNLKSHSSTQDRFQTGNAFNLTEREREIAVLVRAGYDLNMISTTLGIARNTVRVHIRNIMRKSGSRRQIEMIAKIFGHKV